MGFTTYKNRANPHVTIHRDDCGQIRKRGGKHKYGQGEYKRHKTYQAARKYAEQTDIPIIKDCSYCSPDKLSVEPSKKFEKAIKAAMELPIDERAQLAGKLLISLEEPSESEIEQLWVEEAERRLETFREGKVKGIPADEVFRRAIADIS